MTKRLAALAAAIMAIPAAAQQQQPPDPAARLVGTPVFIDGTILYGSVAGVSRSPDGRIRQILIRPAAPSSRMYALDWTEVRYDAASGTVIVSAAEPQVAKTTR